jgi:hypoxanthine phosphoribosyltransferase
VAGLQSGGYFVAVTLAKLLGVTCIPGLDVSKTEGDVRSLSGAVVLNPAYIRGKRVLGVDDTVITGTLTRLLREQVEAAGGEFRMATLVGVGDFPVEQIKYAGSYMPVAPSMPWAELMKP